MVRRVSVQFIAELVSFKRGMREGADEVRKVKQEAVAAQREVAGLGEAGEKAGRQLGDGLVRGADGKLRDSKGRFVKAGQESGKGFGDGFEQGSRAGLLKVAGILGGGLLKAGGAAPWKGLAAVPATAGAAAASLQAIPPLLTAIGGGLGAIPTLAAGAAGSIGTLKLATAGMGDALEELFAPPKNASPYEQLSRNGLAFVQEVGRQKQALLGLRELAQDQVFAGLDGELHDLAAVALPFLTNQVSRFGTTWNTTFKQVAAVGRDRQFLAGLDDAFGSVDGFFDKVNTRIPATGRSLGQLFTGSIPFVDQFGDSLLEYVDQFNAWIDRSAQSGKLEGFFTDAAEQADALLDLSREILVIVGRIGGMQSGSTLLRDMADAVARFNAEAHNMRDVEGIIRTGNAAIAGVVDVLVVLGSTLGETLADPGTAAAVALFFDVLKVGAQIVGGLAQTFALLPDDIQAVVLAGAALAIVGGKMSTAFGKAHTALGGFNDRLRDAGPRGAKTADVLGRAEKAATRFGIAMVAAQLASAAFGSDLNPQVDALASRLQKFARDGQIAGEMARIFGGDMGKLETAIKDVADSGAWSDFARGTAGLIEGWTGLGTVFDDSLTKSKERIGALDSALTDMVAAGGMEQARAAFDRIAESAAKQGVSTTELMAVLPGYAAAIDRAKVAGDGQAQATAAVEQRNRLLTGSMQGAIAAMGSFTRAWQVLNGAQLSSDEASLAAKDAIDQVKQSFKDNTDTVTGNSRAALENRIAVGQAAQAAAEAAQRKYEETGSVEQASTTYDTYIAALRSTLEQTNLTDAEIAALLGTYSKMPPVKSTEVSAPGATTATGQVQDFNFAVRNVPPSKTVPFWATTEEAKAAVEALQTKIDSLHGKDVLLRAQVYWTSSGNLHVPGGTQLKDRWGGVHEGGYMKAATGMVREAAMFGPRSPGRYLIAEPETQGEAFIPKRGDRERSISIGRRAMEWYGMTVVPKSWVSASRYGLSMMQTAGSAPTPGPVTHDNRISVYPQRADFTLTDLSALEARRDALARVGRPR